MKIQRWLLFVGMFIWSPIWCQHTLPADFCIESNELQLFTKINELRAAYGKEKLQLSAALSFVAKTHVADLRDNHPDTSVCNLSSWSNKGNWTACCYNAYVPKPDCMWDKPKELTPYGYRGYEFITYFEDAINVDSVINLFSDTREVLNMILDQNEYEKKKWACCGIGINKHYISIWFGQRRDALSPPPLCSNTEELVVSIQPTASTTSSAFYLIFGSFSNLQEGKEALKKLKKSDFEDAGLITKNGKTRLYLNKFNSLKEAMYAKQQLPSAYSDAWILKE